jgi:hypothetical protein
MDLQHCLNPFYLEAALFVGRSRRLRRRSLRSGTPFSTLSGRRRCRRAGGIFLSLRESRGLIGPKRLSLGGCLGIRLLVKFSTTSL